MGEFSIEDAAKQDAILKALVTDLSGGLREIIFPVSILPELCSVGVAYDGSSFIGINDINSSDSILCGDPRTLVRVNDSIADIEKIEYWIICDIIDTEGNPHPNCARSQLQRLQNELAKTWEGGQLMVGAEPEAFFVEKKEKLGTVNGGNSNYFNPRDPKSFLIAEIANVLSTMGFEVERAHAEVGDEQFEINWRFDTAERTADRIQYYKLIAHKVARNYGFDITFLPKPYPTRNGSGMHCHLSVANEKGNLFYDEGRTEFKNFSEKSLQFLTGILSHARSLSAIANPTEVSYSRLVPGFEAPCVIAMGACNRSALCRIPAVANPKLWARGIRAEFRFPDPMTNPYLLAAGFIAAGLDGLSKKIVFCGFCEENLYALGLQELRDRNFDLLPRTLWESFSEFEKNEVLRERLGASMHSSFSSILIDEIDSCQPFANAESVRRHYFD
jgi:glutamine synthetase